MQADIGIEACCDEIARGLRPGRSRRHGACRVEPAGSKRLELCPG